MKDICPPCIKARNKWFDSNPTQVLPAGASFAHGSGAHYDTTTQAIAWRRTDRYNTWRDLVKTNTAAIAAHCRANH